MHYLCSVPIMYNCKYIIQFSRVIVEDFWCREGWYTAKKDCKYCEHPAAGISMSTDIS